MLCICWERNPVILAPKSQYPTLRNTRCESHATNRCRCLHQRQYTSSPYHVHSETKWPWGPNLTSVQYMHVCVWEGFSLTCRVWNFSTNLVRKWQKKPSHSWFLASNLFLWPACCASVLLMFRGLVFILSRKPCITHSEMKGQFTNTSCRHTFIIFPDVWSVTCWSVSKFALRGLVPDTRFLLQRLTFPPFTFIFLGEGYTEIADALKN